MNNSDKLKQVIEKAVENGFKEVSEVTLEDFFDLSTSYYVEATYALLFNHDFAKAYWGDVGVCMLFGEEASKDGCCVIYDAGKDCSTSSWKYHLQQAVLEEDPLSYYYSKLDNK